MKLLPGVRASERSAGGGGEDARRLRLLLGAVEKAGSVPERGDWARGGERDLKAGGGGGTLLLHCSRERRPARGSAGALLAGSRCVSNFKPHSACWKNVSVNLGTSALAFWLEGCVGVGGWV